MALVEVIDQLQIKNNPTQGVLTASRMIGGTGWLVADNTARDAIPAASRETGLEVKVLSPEKYFKLESDLTTWTEIVQTGFIETSEKGAADGVAPLDSDGFIPSVHIKNLFLNDSFVVADEAAMLALVSLTGNFAIREDSGDVYVKLNNNGPPSVIGDWSILSSPGVATVNGLTGGVSIDFTTLLTWGSSEAQFQAKVIASDYAGTTNSAISTLQGRATALETDQHTHSNKSIIDNIIDSGDGLSYWANDGTYVALHTHTNKVAIDKVIDSGPGILFLADDGDYKATPGGLGDAPIDGSTYARKDAAWTAIGGTIGGSIADNQVAVGNGSDAIDGSADFLWTGTIFTAQNGTSSFIANMAAIPTVVLAGTGTNNNSSITVSAAGTGTAQAYFDALVATTGGDPFIRFRDASNWSYALGVDNSDSNNLKLRYIASGAASPSNGTALLSITTAGLFTFHSNVGGGGSTNFLRADGTWAAPAGGGDVTKVGTPVINEIGVWTGDGTIKGATDTDVNAILGRVRIDSRVTDSVHFSHYDMSGNAEYAIKQIAAGTTILNAATGQTLQFAIAGATKWQLTANGELNAFDGSNMKFGITTGTKIGTSTSEKIGFWNTTPVIQPVHIIDASGGGTVDAEARTAINALLAQFASLGLQAAS